MTNQLGIIPEFMPINMGPPLPKSMGIYWPWYRPPEVPEVVAPPAVVYPPVAYPPVAPPVVAYPPVAPPAAPPVVVYPPVAVPEAPPVAALYVCPECGAQFADLSDWYAHMEEIHPAVPPEIPIEIFTCPTCRAQFPTFDELQTHMAEVHPPEFGISTMSYPPGGGIITTDKPTYRLGERVTLTARPSPGYEFSHWEGIPGLPTDLTYRFPIDRDMIITGVFKLLEELPPEVPMPPPPEVPEVPEVPAMSPEEALEDFRNFALEVNIELGGSYVAGVLTPPPDWVGSVTEWSRHVQVEAAKRYLFWPEKFKLLPLSIRALVLA